MLGYQNAAFNAIKQLSQINVQCRHRFTLRTGKLQQVNKSKSRNDTVTNCKSNCNTPPTEFSCNLSRSTFQSRSKQAELQRVFVQGGVLLVMLDADRALSDTGSQAQAQTADM